MVHGALLFLVLYAGSVVAERWQQMLEVQGELERRAMGSRRPFQLMDWTPTP